MKADEMVIREILERVQESVRALDYEGVRDFIPDDGLYFGSVARIARGYEELRAKQFNLVWPNIQDFHIVTDTVNVKVAGTFGWATCMFESSGTRPDGTAFQRGGRMTFVFEHRDGHWVMIHSHDSLDPTVPATVTE